MKNIKVIILLSVFGCFKTLNGQSLDSFLTLGAEHSLALKKAYADVEISLLNIDKVSVIQDPTISFGYFIKPIETRLGSQVSKFSLRQKVPWFGQVSKEKEVLKHRAQMNYHVFETKKQTLFLDIKTIYYSLLEAKERIQIKEEHLKLLYDDKKQAQTRYEQGKQSKIDLIRIELEIDELISEIKGLQLELEKQKQSFNFKLHRSFDTEISIIEPLKMPTSENSNSKINLESHPSIKILDENIEMNQSGIEFSKAKNKPKLSLGLDYTIIEMIPNSTIVNNGNDAFWPTIQLSIPISSSKNKAEIKTAELMLEKAELSKEHMVLELKNQFSSLELETQSLINDIVQLNSTLSKYEQILNLQYFEYKTFKLKFEDILKTKKDILKVKYNRLSKLKQLNIVQAQMEFYSYSVKQ
ncbi:MAG: TolC family protein [Flavobacteriales bacterium]